MKDHTDIHPDCEGVRLEYVWKHPNGRTRRTPIASVNCPHCGTVATGAIRDMEELEDQHRRAGWNEFLKQNPDWTPVARSIGHIFRGVVL